MPLSPRGRTGKRRRTRNLNSQTSDDESACAAASSQSIPDIPQVQAELAAGKITNESAKKPPSLSHEKAIDSTPTANFYGPSISRGQWTKSSDILHTLLSSFPGRDEQINDLIAIVLGYRAGEKISSQQLHEQPCGLAGSTALFAYGAAATGKTAVVNAVLRACCVPFASVNCIEACTPRLLYEQILSQLTDVFAAMTTPLRNETSSVPRAPMRCESMHAFFAKLHNLCAGPTSTPSARKSTSTMPKQTTYIVLDNAERLRTLPPNILPALLRISEIIKVPICPILISSIVWEKFRGGTGCLEPQLIHFPAYTKRTSLAIMTMHLPRLVSAANADYAETTGKTGAVAAGATTAITFATEELLQSQFCGLLFDVFHGPCRDLNELRHVAHLLYPIYLEPVRQGAVAVDNAGALYRNIVPHFKKQLSRLYLREMSSAEWGAAHAPDAGAGLAGVAPRHRTLELPFLSKYILIAAYLASYNPANTDVRMFAKRQNKSRGTRRGTNKKQRERVPQYLLGPKAFPLDRLLAILYSLVEMKTDASAEVYSQISTLVTLRLLSLVSSTDNLHTPRYKCLLTLTEVQRVATSVSIDITRYMHDAELH